MALRRLSSFGNMTVRPEEFYAVAKALKDAVVVPSGEGRYRTTAGRAYYSVYWAACLQICINHRVNPPSELPHEALSLKLASTQGDVDVRKFGDLLNSLRLLRIKSDYHLGRIVEEVAADDAVDDAKTALDMLPTVGPRLPWVDPTH